jgi:hypothetical protein
MFIKAGPLAVIDGYSSSSEPRRAVSPSPKSPGPSLYPPSLTAQDKAKFTQYFNKCGPVNGILSGTCMDMSFLKSCFWSQSLSQGEKAREVFVKSKLPVEKLSEIWYVLSSLSRTLMLMYHLQEVVGYSESWIVGCCRLHHRHVSHPGFDVWPTPFFPNYSPSWLI